MSAIDDLISGKTTKQTIQPQIKGNVQPVPTQNWKGQQIPAEIPTKNLVSYDHTTGNKTFSLPAFTGGGVYTEDKNGNLINTGHSNYGGEPAISGQERDDKIPVSLGGDNSNPNNIQDIPMSVARPQDKAETAIAKQVKQGQIQPKAAVGKIVRQKQQISGQAPSESLGANFVSSLGGAAEKTIKVPLQAATNIVPAGLKERIGAAVQAIKQGSFKPLEQSFSNQLNEFVQNNIPKEGDDPKTQQAKLGNLAFAFAFGEGGGLEENAAKNAVEKETPALASRIKDATPAYDKSLVGDYVTNAEGKSIPRVSEGKGLTGKRIVNTSASELKQAEELSKIKNYPDKGTALEKSQAVHSEITKEAQGLKTSLAEEDKADPLVSEAKDILSKNVFDKMNSDARDAFINRGRASKLGAVDDPAKNIVGRYGQNVADALSNYDGSRAGILDLRQKLDSIYEDARGKAAFGSDHRNALDEMHTSVRDYLNQELKESTTNIDTQASLDKQSRLFRAKDVLDSKAANEATTRFGRYGQRHPVQKKIANSTAMRVGMGLGIGTLAGGSIYTVGKKLGQKIGTVPKSPTKIKSPKSNKPKRV